MPALCCYDDAYALGRDRKFHEELGVYYTVIHYVDSFDGLSVDPNKASIYFPGYDAEPAFRETYDLTFGTGLYVTNAGHEWIDFMNLGVDKGSGVAHPCEKLRIAIEDVAAAGDTHNDIPMLERTGHSFIVANAKKHMRSHAKYMVPSNNDGGVFALIDAILAAR